MTTEVYYRKQGNEYVPVSLFNTFPQGVSVVVVDGSYTQTMYQVPDQRSLFFGALMQCKEHFVDALVDASKTRQPSAMSPEAIADWAKLIAAHGNEFAVMQHPSASDVVDTGLKSLEGKLCSLTEHPAVRDAFEKLLVTIELVAKEQK